MTLPRNGNAFNRNLGDLLRRVQLPARGLFYSLLNFLRAGDPYGSLLMSYADMARVLSSRHKPISEAAVRQAMGELRAVGVIVKEAGDSFYCPFLIAERRRDALKSELRLLMGHYRQFLVSGPMDLCGRGEPSDPGASRFRTTSLRREQTPTPGRRSVPNV